MKLSTIQGQSIDKIIKIPCVVDKIALKSLILNDIKKEYIIMKLKDVRKIAIKYCEENKCKYTYISYNDTDEFYLTESEDKHTVFYINRNGSLNACRNTEYAAEFHKELRRRKKIRNKSGKKEVAHIANRDSMNVELVDEEDE